MRNLDLACLRLFVLTVEKGGLGRAAEAVGRSQPAASLQLKRPEEEVGEPLLRRQGRHLVLTPAGEDFLPAARQIVEMHDAALARRLTTRLSGPVRLGIAQDLADAMLTHVLAEFSRNHPTLELLLRTDKMGELIEATRNGELDLALVFEPDPGAGTGEVIGRLPMCWVGRRGDIPQPGGEVRLVAFDGACCFNRAAEQALAGEGRAWRRSFTSASLASQWTAIRAGLGIGIRTPLGLPHDLGPIVPAAALPALPAVSLRLLRRPGLTSRAGQDLATLLRMRCQTLSMTGAARTVGAASDR